MPSPSSRIRGCVPSILLGISGLSLHRRDCTRRQHEFFCEHAIARVFCLAVFHRSRSQDCVGRCVVHLCIWCMAAAYASKTLEASRIDRVVTELARPRQTLIRSEPCVLRCRKLSRRRCINQAESWVQIRTHSPCLTIGHQLRVRHKVASTNPCIAQKMLIKKDAPSVDAFFMSP
jgi:hypothetical protein